MTETKPASPLCGALEGRAVIVTGASSGIGAAAARLFAAEGAAVMLAARREDRLRDLEDEIRAAGGRAAHLAGDVADPAFAPALTRAALDAFGALDAAFDNAGTLGAPGPLEALSPEEWRRVIEVNLSSAFHLARAQIPALRAAARSGRGASLVFTSSFVGHATGLPGMAAYGAAKAGLVGLARGLAAELGPEGVRVNALLPGGTLTEMAGEDPDHLAAVARMHALKRLATPEEIARAALFLISDAGYFVTGSALFADGGNAISKA